MNRIFEKHLFTDRSMFYNEVINLTLKLKKDYGFYLVPMIINYNKDLLENLKTKEHKAKMILYYNKETKTVSYVVFLKNNIIIKYIEADSKFAYTLMKELCDKYKELDDKLKYGW